MPSSRADLKAQLKDSAKASDSNSSAVAELTGLNEKLTREKATLQTQLQATSDLQARLAASDRVVEQQAAGLAAQATETERLQNQTQGS